MNVISAGRKLIPSLMLLLFAGPLLAETANTTEYVKPGIDLTKYHKVMIKPLNISEIEVLKPAWEQGNDEEWVFEEGTGTAIQKLFMDAMHKELVVNGGYPMVSESGADVLRIEVEILSITPFMKPGSQTGDEGYEVETLGSGDLVVSAELRDSQTRELLILVEGERAIGDKYKKLNRDNHIKNLNNLFSGWAIRIREALKAGH